MVQLIITNGAMQSKNKNKLTLLERAVLVAVYVMAGSGVGLVIAIMAVSKLWTEITLLVFMAAILFLMGSIAIGSKQ